MLARVTSALAKFLVPLSNTSSSTSEGRVREQGDFKRFNKKAKPQLKLVPLPEEVPPQPKNEAPPTSQTSAPTSQSFVELFSLLGEQRSLILKWLGSKTYQTLVRDRRGTFRKGSMFDHKAE